MSSLTNFNRFEDLIDVFFHADIKASDKSHISPKLNAKENDQEIFLSFELPGFAKEDIDIHLEENQLIISAKRPPEKMDEQSKWLKKEISNKSYRRQLTLPDNINGNKISAESQNGILTILLPKTPKEQTIKKINITG
jgi:HSP20 family protein